MESLIQIVVPIVTALIAFFAAVIKTRYDLKKQIEINKTEMERLKETHKLEMEKIQVQLDSQSKLYEENAKTDVTKDFVTSMLKEPASALEFMQSMQKMAEFAEKNTPKK